jgi:hypothetical protein
MRPCVGCAHHICILQARKCTSARSRQHYWLHRRHRAGWGDFSNQNDPRPFAMPTRWRGACDTKNRQELAKCSGVGMPSIKPPPQLPISRTSNLLHSLLLPELMITPSSLNPSPRALQRGHFASAGPGRAVPLSALELRRSRGQARLSMPHFGSVHLASVC